jgi:predicted nucleic acid-binding protein
MIYLDANLFIYAYYKTKKGKKLTPKIQWMKEEAKKIILKINKHDGEFCISIIQLAETVNLLKHAMSWEALRQFLLGIISNNSIEIIEVSNLLYINSIDKITKYNMDSNDISAYLIMKEKGVNQIFTFDKHFRKLKDIKCLPQFPNNFK